jgi:PAS domain S-box-containing protein
VWTVAGTVLLLSVYGYYQFGLGETRERMATVATMLTLALLLAWALYTSLGLKRRAESLRARFDFVEQAEAVSGLGTFEFDLIADRWTSSQNLDRLFGLDDRLSRTFQGWGSLLHPDDREETSRYLQTVISARDEFDREYRIVRPSDGTVRWVHGRGRIEAGPGDALRMFGTIQDISARHAALETQRLQVAALNAAADAVVITDPAGLIEWVNAAFTETTGYSAEEALGKNPRDLLKSGTQDASYYGDLWATISAGKVWRGELTNRRKDGSTYPEEMTITPVRDAKGQLAHFVAIKRDVTEKQKLEGRFLQAQKMEVVGRLAGGVAHDFNNLLTVINGTADIAMSDLADDHPLKQDLQAIHDAGERAAVLTAQLLAFSRKQVLKQEVARLGDLVARMHSLIRRLVGEDIAVHISGSDEGRVLIDAGQFSQVILNLAVNARDAMPTGGSLTIQTSDVDVDESFVGSHPAARLGPHVMVTISDTGCGMDAAVKARLFEPFFTTKETGKGTGLGLSTVYGIVKQSDGTIWVYSEPGQGTVFKVLIPRTDQPVQGAPRPDISRRETGGEAILLVEDAVNLRQLASRILRGAGYDVTEAGTAPEALALLAGRAQSIQLLLTDVVLPEMSGRELADRVTRHDSGIKVLYTSGYTDDAVLRHGVLANDAHFIAKPYSAAGLRRKVREVLDEPARSTSEG